MRDIGRAIDSTDLSAVRRKLTDAGWSKERWNTALLDYFRFLYLIGKYPNETIVPWTADLDEVWHAHILDTKQYAADCERIFGRFIHHHPDLQKVADGDALSLKGRTRDLFSHQFASSGRERSSVAKTETQDDHFLLWLVVMSSIGDSSPSHHESSHHRADSAPTDAGFGHHGHDQPVEAGGDHGGDASGSGDSGSSDGGGGDSGGGSSCGGGGDSGGSSCGGGGGGD
jgi:uncharacterized membrane protein YgcG